MLSINLCGVYWSRNVLTMTNILHSISSWAALQTGLAPREGGTRLGRRCVVCVLGGECVHARRGELVVGSVCTLGGGN